MSGLACRCGRAMRYDAKTRRAVCDSCAGKVPVKRTRARLEAAGVQASPFHDAPESAVQSRIIGLLRERGFLVIRFNSGKGTTAAGNELAAYYIIGLHDPKSRSGRNVSSGFPDVMAMRGVLDENGDVVSCECHLIEVKKSGGRLRESQKRFIGWARQHGVKVHICEDWDHAEELVAALS